MTELTPERIEAMFQEMELFADAMSALPPPQCYECQEFFEPEDVMLEIVVMDDGDPENGPRPGAQPFEVLVHIACAPDRK